MPLRVFFSSFYNAVLSASHLDDKEHFLIILTYLFSGADLAEQDMVVTRQHFSLFTSIAAIPYNA